MNQLVQKTILLVLSHTILLGCGFYYGSRIKISDKSVSSTYQSVNTIAEPNIETLPVPGVHWFTQIGDSTCPATHPIKGKFKDMVNVYYLPDNKQYNRVKAELCFASKEFAEESGFHNRDPK